MAPIIGEVLIHSMIGEDLTEQGDCCGKQELEMVVGRDVAIFHAVPLDVGTVSMRELGSCTVHQVEEGVDGLTGNEGIVFRVDLKLIEGRERAPFERWTWRGKNTRWWW